MTREERFELDVHYVWHITFMGNMGIILCTVLKMLRCEGICQEGKATM